jgi:hypothetical protein
MPATYEPIATHTIPSTTASYTFTSIPATYTDLVLIVNGQNTSSDQGLTCQVGTGSIDTAANYSWSYVLGSGTSALSGRVANDTSAVVGRMGNDNSTSIVHFMNYSNTTTKKTILGRGNNGAYAIQHVGLWQGTTAINTIKIFNLTSVSFAAGVVLTLYGIKAA